MYIIVAWSQILKQSVMHMHTSSINFMHAGGHSLYNYYNSVCHGYQTLSHLNQEKKVKTIVILTYWYQCIHTYKG